MTVRVWLLLLLAGAFLLTYRVSDPAQACCPAPPSGKPVVNADQTVILIWDAATKTQHFIRQASFKSGADDFGFLVPTPSQPELEESGNEAFPFLLKLTEPETKQVPWLSRITCGCSANPGRKLAGSAAPVVHVLQEKLVAGFQAAVLETNSAAALANWLKANGYAYSPEVEAWAKPYVADGWNITALKVAKGADGKGQTDVAAAALRMTFKTDRPLFPYREPDPKRSVADLGVSRRLLRIYFLAEARYQGELTREVPWTGQVAWAGRLGPEDRRRALQLLKLPETTGPADWWLTEFEDDWPYRVAPADVYFARDSHQDTVRRPPIIQYVSSPWPGDVMVYALAAALVLPPLFRRVRRAWKP
jgi:hypothetical protein